MRTGRNDGSFVGNFLVAAALVLGIILPASASDNHGGGEKVITIAPRAEARIGDKQLVLVYSAGRLFAFLEGFTTGVPIVGAEIEATVNFLAESLIEAAPGVYRSAPIALSGGRNEIEIATKVGADHDKATLFMDVAATAVAASSLTALPPPAIPGWIFLLTGTLIYGGVTIVFWRRARRSGAPASDGPGNEPIREPRPHAAE